MNGDNVMILVAYASKYGSSREIAEHIAQRVREKGSKPPRQPLEVILDYVAGFCRLNRPAVPARVLGQPRHRQQRSNPSPHWYVLWWVLSF